MSTLVSNLIGRALARLSRALALARIPPTRPTAIAAAVGGGHAEADKRNERRCLEELTSAFASLD